MLFFEPGTQNWSRTFTVWIEDIQVSFPARMMAQVVRGGFLRKIRKGTRFFSALNTLFFSLYSLHAQAAPPKGFAAPVDETVSQPSLPLALVPEALVPMAAVESSREETGLASWYGEGDGFEEMTTASGEPRRSDRATCALRTLPFGTLLEVENLWNGKRAIARVNDRGPFVRGRVVDVSVMVAQELGLVESGLAAVRVRRLGPFGLPLMAPPPRFDEVSEPLLRRGDTPVDLAKDVSVRLGDAFPQLVAGPLGWLLGAGLPGEVGVPPPLGIVHVRPPYLRRETA